MILRPEATEIAVSELVGGGIRWHMLAPMGLALLSNQTGGRESHLYWRTLRSLRRVIVLLVTLPKQCLELLGELVHVALPRLTTLPPPQHAVTQQQPQEQAEYHPAREERHGHVLR